MTQCPFCLKVYDESEYTRCPYCRDHHSRSRNCLTSKKTKIVKVVKISQKH